MPQQSRTQNRAAMSRRSAVAMLGLAACGLKSRAAAARPEFGLPAPPLPRLDQEGRLDRDGAKIWYGVVGSGPAAVLLHGGLCSADVWGWQVEALLAAGHKVVLIDSRGHGRSTLGTRPLFYELLADDVGAVIDAQGLDRPALVGWSDGAVLALLLAMRRGARLRSVYAFGANMNKDGVRADAAEAPILRVVGPLLVAAYQALSPTPDGFADLQKQVRAMQGAMTPYGAAQLSAIRGPKVMIVGAEQDEFITPEHPAFLAKTIPGARRQIIAGAGHFAPWTAKDAFNASLLGFLGQRATGRA